MPTTGVNQFKLTHRNEREAVVATVAEAVAAEAQDGDQMMTPKRNVFAGSQSIDRSNQITEKERNNLNFFNANVHRDCAITQSCIFL